MSSQYYVTPALLARIDAMSRWQKNFRVAGATFKNHPDRPSLSISGGDSSLSLTDSPLLIVTSRTDGNKSTWKQQLAKNDGSSADDASGESGTVTNSDDSTTEQDPVFNLPAQASLLFKFTADDGTVVRFRIRDRGVFPVKVTQDGGGQGSSTTKATFTYTVKDLADNELGTHVALSRARENGAVNAGGADPPKPFGIAFYNGSTLVLWDAGETYQTTECAPDAQVPMSQVVHDVSGQTAEEAIDGLASSVFSLVPDPNA